ncbi:MAG TPA: hypothetical protein VKA10_00855 [Prolixibacteraceae bacterium]|nr:hypothetical protein [Prolixibacteraceae bacterium]
MPRIFRDILYSNFFAAVFWGFGSYLLAGNWQYNFTNKFNFYIWIFYTAVIVLLPVAIYLIWMIKRVAD